MSESDPRIRLAHMRDAAKQAVEFIKGRTQQDLNDDPMLALATQKCIEIIGEAAKKVPEELRQSYSEVPWRSIAGARDRFSHGYFQIDHDIQWEIPSRDLPRLLQQLEKILNELK